MFVAQPSGLFLISFSVGVSPETKYLSLIFCVNVNLTGSLCQKTGNTFRARVNVKRNWNFLCRNRLW